MQDPRLQWLPVLAVGWRPRPGLLACSYDTPACSYGSSFPRTQYSLGEDYPRGQFQGQGPFGATLEGGPYPEYLLCAHDDSGS